MNDKQTEQVETQQPEKKTESQSQETQLPDERHILMQRARTMGLTFSPNIGVETLRARINEAIQSNEKPVQEPKREQNEERRPVPPRVAAELEAAKRPPRKLTQSEIRKKLQKEQLKLVRCRITCLNPSKKDLPGEIITVSNRYLGNVRKFVPFGDQTENGYHLPFILYNELKNKKFLHIQTKKAPRDGITVKTGYVPEFAIEILPPLNRRELQKLAQRQAMAAGTVDDEIE